MYSANCSFNSCVKQSHKDSVQNATVEEQLSSKTIHPATRAQLHLPSLLFSLGSRLNLSSPEDQRFPALNLSSRGPAICSPQSLLQRTSDLQSTISPPEDQRFAVHNLFSRGPEICSPQSLLLRTSDFQPSISPPEDQRFAALNLSSRGPAICSPQSLLLRTRDFQPSISPPEDQRFSALNLSSLKCCFTSIETVGLLGTEAQDGHLDFHTGEL